MTTVQLLLTSKTLNSIYQLKKPKLLMTMLTKLSNTNPTLLDQKLPLMVFKLPSNPTLIELITMKLPLLNYTTHQLVPKNNQLMTILNYTGLKINLMNQKLFMLTKLNNTNKLILLLMLLLLNSLLLKHISNLLVLLKKLSSFNQRANLLLSLKNLVNPPTNYLPSTNSSFNLSLKCQLNLRLLNHQFKLL